LCRDGSGAYGEAARRALPQAVQVSDRWHLWHLLGEAARKEVLAHCSCRAEGTPRRSTGPTPRPACGWRCRRACAAAGVLVPGPAVAAAPAGGRGCGRVHIWPGRAVHAGSGQLVGIVRRSGRCVGLAADHMPAQSGQPGRCGFGPGSLPGRRSGWRELTPSTTRTHA
jgi:hypothetical protein